LSNRLTPQEIKAIRKAGGLTQAEFAKRLKVGIASIKRWELGLVIQNESADESIRQFEQDRKMGDEIIMWEILVPTIRRADDRPIRRRFHRVWDEKVRAISGGLTVMTPAKGQWVCPVSSELFVERMIPVRFLATETQKDEIVDMTAVYYDQLAVLCYAIANRVTMRSLEDAKRNINRRKNA
jgi:transcriptional regulator with XRE-family HTH domain